MVFVHQMYILDVADLYAIPNIRNVRNKKNTRKGMFAKKPFIFLTLPVSLDQAGRPAGFALDKSRVAKE